MPAGIVSHLWRALRHALGKILTWAGATFVVTALLVEVIAVVASGSPALRSPATHLAAVALALALAYAVGLLVLIAETVTLLAHGATDLERTGVSAVERLERVKQPL